MPFIQFQAKQIHYTVTGKGCPVVLLHGFCEDSSMWKKFSQDWPHQVITIDLAGFGQSELVAPFSMDLLADMVKKVLEELKAERCILLGHSMGGYVGLAFAEKYADHLLGLGMIHSHPFADSATKKASRQKSIEFISRNGTILYVKQLIPQLFAPNFVGSNDFLIHRLIFAASKYSVEAIKASLEAMMKRPDRTEVLKHIACPVLFIIGKLDQVISYENSGAQITMPNLSAVHILPRVGHMGTYESPRKTQKIVRKFIEFCEAQS